MSEETDYKLVTCTDDYKDGREGLAIYQNGNDLRISGFYDSMAALPDLGLKLSELIPEGFALVPIEPTAEMVFAANWSVYPEVCEVDMTKAYKRMITAYQEGK